MFMTVTVANQAQKDSPRPVMVSDTLCSANSTTDHYWLRAIFLSFFDQSRVTDAKGTMSCRTERVVSVHPSVHPSCLVKPCKTSLRSSQASEAF